MEVVIMRVSYFARYRVRLRTKDWKYEKLVLRTPELEAMLGPKKDAAVYIQVGIDEEQQKWHIGPVVPGWAN
jgi:hypothetical protein